MKNKFKKFFIWFIVAIIIMFSLLQVLYYTRVPIYLVTDSIYYKTTIDYQKTTLKYKALLNNNKIVYVVDELSNGEWREYNYRENSMIILSPYISMLYCLDDDFEFTNPFVTIDKSCVGEILNASGDYLSGFEKLAEQLKIEKQNVYLLSSKDWPTSSTKAKAFELIFGVEGLTKINLKGNELEQKAYEIVDKINKEESVEVVSTGTTLISYFNKIENNINYNVEAYQALSVPLNSLHYIIYEDLTPLLDKKNYNDNTIVLSTKLKNLQAGLINFFLRLSRDLKSQLF